MRIHSRVLERIIQHARREYPLECCGLLSGTGQEIDSLQPTPNQRRSRKEFFVPVTELFAFFQELRRTGKQHLGIYHSHPLTESFPSPRDLVEFHYPEVSYWIISLKGKKPDIGCFVCGKKGFERVSFEVIEKGLPKDTKKRAQKEPQSVK
ncbi:M67 family metallopeptidase [Acidobacteria bacterium AH-259-D05]|nr:M67 family metallopeptidase [Acidobacteria bacterium AH-259-D05]